jgi:uncharacterized membrane protein YccC
MSGGTLEIYRILSIENFFEMLRLFDFLVVYVLFCVCICVCLSLVSLLTS